MSTDPTMAEDEITYVRDDAETAITEKREIIRSIAQFAVTALQSLDDGTDHALLQGIADELAKVSTHRATSPAGQADALRKCTGAVEVTVTDGDVTATSHATQRVNVLGPNLNQAGCALGTMHVHAAGCADIKRSARKYGYVLGAPERGGNGWEIDVESMEDIVEHVYPAGDFEYTGPDDENYGSYRGDIHMFPCVTVPESVRTIGAV